MALKLLQGGKVKHLKDRYPHCPMCQKTFDYAENATGPYAEMSRELAKENGPYDAVEVHVFGYFGSRVFDECQVKAYVCETCLPLLLALLGSQEIEGSLEDREAFRAKLEELREKALEALKPLIKTLPA